MATYSTTIYNTMPIYGMAPTSKWDVDKWDEFKWTTDDDLPIKFTKLISEGLDADDFTGKNVTKLISEAMPIYGMAPTSKWDVDKWDEFKWTTDDDLPIKFTKLISEAIDADDDTQKRITKLISEAIDADDTLIKHVTKGISEGVNINDAAHKILTRLISDSLSANDALDIFKQRESWTVLFGDVTDATERNIPTWTTQTVSSAVWTTLTVSACSWSALS